MSTKKMSVMDGLKFGWKVIKWGIIVVLLLIFFLLMLRVIVMSLIPPTI